MDAATLDELRTLRARAYGPDADIDHDPAALQRLRELEARGGATAMLADAPAVSPAADTTHARPAQPGDAARSDPEGAQGDAASTGIESPSGAGEPDAAQGAPAPGAPDASAPGAPDAPAAATGRRAPRLIAALWAASVVVAAALAAVVTYALVAIAPVSASSGAPQIDTLENDPLIELPSGFMGAGPSSLAFEYHGVTLFETAGGYGGVGTECFAVVPTEEIPEEGTETNGWSMAGLFYTGCRVGAFPATVQFAVDSSAPQELRDRFPPDSALQFVFDGDRIGVFLDSGGAEPR